MGEASVVRIRSQLALEGCFVIDRQGGIELPVGIGQQAVNIVPAPITIVPASLGARLPLPPNWDDETPSEVFARDTKVLGRPRLRTTYRPCHTVLVMILHASRSTALSARSKDSSIELGAQVRGECCRDCPTIGTAPRPHSSNQGLLRVGYDSEVTPVSMGGVVRQRRGCR